MVYSAAKIVTERIALHKDFDTKHIQKIKETPRIIQKYDKVDLDRINSEEITIALEEFANKMIETLPESNLVNFYNNINRVKIRRNLIPKLIGVEGLYNTLTNTITLETDSELIDTVTFFHELMHMASSTIKNGILYTGFSQKTSGKIGFGLTEGYTQLVTERVFKKKPIYEAYIKEIEIAHNVEKIIGKEKMQELFFNTNLKGLIEELGKYSDEEETLAFIKKVDFITKYETLVRTNFSCQSKLVEEAQKDVYKYLLRTYKRKQENQLKEGIINKKEFIDQMAGFIYEIKLDKYRNGIMNKKSKKEVINSVLTNEKLHTEVHQKIYALHMKNSN